jgi:hypothetical protein
MVKSLLKVVTFKAFCPTWTSIYHETILPVAPPSFPWKRESRQSHQLSVNGYSWIPNCSGMTTEMQLSAISDKSSAAVAYTLKFTAEFPPNSLTVFSLIACFLRLLISDFCLLAPRMQFRRWMLDVLCSMLSFYRLYLLRYGA